MAQYVWRCTLQKNVVGIDGLIDGLYNDCMTTSLDLPGDPDWREYQGHRFAPPGVLWVPPKIELVRIAIDKKWQAGYGLDPSNEPLDFLFWSPHVIVDYPIPPALKAKYESQDYEILKDIFSSPLVQMYTSRTAYVEGFFIDVFVSGNISFSNKRGKIELA